MDWNIISHKYTGVSIVCKNIVSFCVAFPLLTTMGDNICANDIYNMVFMSDDIVTMTFQYHNSFTEYIYVKYWTMLI